MVRVRAITADEWRLWRGLRLVALREAPSAFGSTLAQWQGAGDTQERWRARLTDVPYNVVAYLDGEPAGIVSGTQPDDAHTVELISMWVAPFARGRGVGDALVNAVVEWAAAQNARTVRLNVVDGNDRALGLYLRHGFIERGVVRDGERELLRAIPAS